MFGVCMVVRWCFVRVGMGGVFFAIRIFGEVGRVGLFLFVCRRIFVRVVSACVVFVVFYVDLGWFGRNFGVVVFFCYGSFSFEFYVGF